MLLRCIFHNYDVSMKCILQKSISMQPNAFVSVCIRDGGTQIFTLCLYTFLAVTVVSLFYFNRLQFTHLVPPSHPTRSFHLLIAHRLLIMYPKAKSPPVCQPKLRLKLIHMLYSVPMNQSSQRSRSVHPDSTAN